MKDNNNSCILFALFYASLLVSPFCEVSSHRYSNASIIGGYDFRMASIATASTSHLTSERDFETSSSSRHLFRIFHLLVEAEKNVYINCIMKKKITASGHVSTTLLPTRFGEWVPQGSYITDLFSSKILTACHCFTQTC